MTLRFPAHAAGRWGGEGIGVGVGFGWGWDDKLGFHRHADSIYMYFCQKF